MPDEQVTITVDVNGHEEERTWNIPDFDRGAFSADKTTGRGYSLLIDPKAREVKRYSWVGPKSTPAWIWHGRGESVKVPINTDGEAVTELLEENVSELLEPVAQHYEGTSLDDGDREGQWSEAWEGGRAPTGERLEWQRELRDRLESLPRMLPPSEYLDWQLRGLGSVGALADDVIECGGIDAHIDECRDLEVTPSSWAHYGLALHDTLEDYIGELYADLEEIWADMEAYAHGEDGDAPSVFELAGAAEDLVRRITIIETYLDIWDRP